MLRIISTIDSESTNLKHEGSEIMASNIVNRTIDFSELNEVYNLILALIVIIYTMTRYSKVKAFAKVESKIPQVHVFHNRKSKRRYKRAKRAEKKMLNKRKDRQSWSLLAIAILAVILIFMGFKEFAFPSLVIVANASGTRIPSRTPILGGFSRDLDVFWNAMCNSSLYHITDELGRTNESLEFKSNFTFLPFIGRMIKKDPRIMMLKKAKKAEWRYLWILMINYTKVIIVAFAISFGLGEIVPGYEFNDKLRWFPIVLALLVGFIACSFSLNLLKMAVRENPVERVISGKKESILLKRFIGGMNEREEWIVSSDFVKRTGSRYTFAESGHSKPKNNSRYLVGSQSTQSQESEIASPEVASESDGTDSHLVINLKSDKRITNHKDVKLGMTFLVVALVVYFIILPIVEVLVKPEDDYDEDSGMTSEEYHDTSNDPFVKNVELCYQGCGMLGILALVSGLIGKKPRTKGSKTCVSCGVEIPEDEDTWTCNGCQTNIPEKDKRKW